MLFYVTTWVNLVWEVVESGHSWNVLICVLTSPHIFVLDKEALYCKTKLWYFCAVEIICWVSHPSMFVLQCPSTIGEELLYNPFLRTKHQCTLRAAGLITTDEEEPFEPPSDELRAQALAEIREQKDDFKYIQWDKEMRFC